MIAVAVDWVMIWFPVTGQFIVNLLGAIALILNLASETWLRLLNECLLVHDAYKLAAR